MPQSNTSRPGRRAEICCWRTIGETARKCTSTSPYVILVAAFLPRKRSYCSCDSHRLPRAHTFNTEDLDLVSSSVVNLQNSRVAKSVWKVKLDADPHSLSTSRHEEAHHPKMISTERSVSKEHQVTRTIQGANLFPRPFCPKELLSMSPKARESSMRMTPSLW